MACPRFVRKIQLLPFATHSVVPVHKSAIRIVSPRPDVEFEECRYAVPIRAADKLEGLAFELRRTGMTGEPGGNIHDVFDTYEPAAVSQRFVDQRFRMGFVNLAVTDQREIEVVNAHRAMVGTADTTK